MITLICISGDRGVGKSTLARRLALNCYLGAVLVEEHPYGILMEDLEIERRCWIGPGGDLHGPFRNATHGTIIAVGSRVSEVVEHVARTRARIHPINMIVHQPSR